IRWKHVMHLIRLLLSGITVLRDGFVPLRVDEHRDRLLAIRAGESEWREVEEWRLDLHRRLDEAVAGTSVPEHPDYDRANRFLISRPALRGRCGVWRMIDYILLRAEVARHPYTLLFATISGAHLYGFLADSDYDLRCAHLLPAEEA